MITRRARDWYIIHRVVMKTALESRVVRWLIVCLVAFLAACFAIFSLNLLTPPRPLTALLPTRTATRRPPPTITPVVYPPTPNLVTAEDFSTPEAFPNARGVNLGYAYADEAYLLTPPLDPGFVRVLNQSFTASDYRNLTLDVTAAPAKNSAPVEYGVMFWHTEDDQGREHFLAFTINTKGTFRLLAYEPVENQDAPNAYQFTEVVPATQTQTIHLDGSPNKIRVDVHPRRLLAYINDELVLDTDAKIINDWRLRRDWDGRVGLVAFAMNVPDAQARFTQFDIYADVKQP